MKPSQITNPSLISDVTFANNYKKRIGFKAILFLNLKLNRIILESVRGQ